MNRLPQHFGLDFGNHTIKLVELKNIETKPELITFGSISTPYGVLNNDNKENIEKLSELVKSLVKESGSKCRNAVVALPESVVSTRVKTFKGIDEKNIDEAVYWDAKQTIPVPIEDLEISSMILGQKKEEKEFLVLRVAATKKIIEIYTKIVVDAGIEPVSLETEGLAVSRVVRKNTNIENIIVLDFGSQTTDMSIIKNGNLIFSQSISTGSDALTRSIMKEFSLEYNQAEQYKIKYGLNELLLEGKIYRTIEPIMRIILNEVVRGIEFYKSQTGFSSPNDIFLVGDGSLLPELIVYISKNLNVNVSLFDPWQNIKMSNDNQKILQDSRSAYTIAVGLALKQIN